MTRRPHTGAPLDSSVSDKESMLDEALLAAFSPSDLPEERHARIIDAALTDPLAAASPAELREAEALRLALNGLGDHPDAALATALVSAWTPASPRFTVRSIHAPVHQPKASWSSRSRASRIAFGFCATSLAVAAGTALVLRRGNTPEIPASSARLYEARSTVNLFNEDFSRGEPSRRIDRIAAVRARELRSNRYAQWGVP